LLSQRDSPEDVYFEGLPQLLHVNHRVIPVFKEYGGIINQTVEPHVVVSDYSDEIKNRRFSTTEWYVSMF
jgi:hypothetical protein